MSSTYDAIIVGTGQAGPYLADRLTSAGQRVAIIERHQFGGTCVNTGCIPTKAMVASAYAAHLARRAHEFGVDTADVRVDFARVQARKSAIAAESRDGLEAWLEGMERCTVYRGHARFESDRVVAVGDERLTAERVFINVGGRAVVPDMPGIGSVPVLTNSSMMTLDHLPDHLVIVGGSYVGLEFGQMFRRFGSRVTIVERSSRLVRREDEDVSAAVLEILRREGIDVRLDADCLRVERRADGVAVGLECAAGDPEVAGSDILMAVGRRPNTDDLGLDKAGVETDEDGYVAVDDTLQTNVPGIWALGDCNGRGAFTHTSFNDAEIVADNLLEGAARRVTDRIPTYALFIDPPLGRAGMSEAEARRTGRRVAVATRPMTKVKRAVEKGETEGFMKVIVDADSRDILGAAILGTGGDEIVHAVLDMMYAGAPYTVLRHAVHIHPTVAELIPTMLGEIQEEPTAGGDKGRVGAEDIPPLRM